MLHDAAIACRAVTKRFVLDVSARALWRILRGDPRLARFTALDGVSIDVPKGQFVGLLGRNGAGKSTLLRAIGGVHSPDSGSIVVDGELAALYELGIGGNEHLEGREFAVRWFEIVGTGGRPLDELLAGVHDFSELGDAYTRPIRTYSSGMRARLFFAVATALPSVVYVIDEMLSVGDEYFQNKSWRRLRERLAGGASGLIATHDWSAVLKLCQTCYIIDGGRIAEYGPSPAVVRHYLGTSMDDLPSGAKFAGSLPERFEADSLAPFKGTVDIDVSAPGEVQFGLSVERFVAGFGWEHILHAAPRAVTSRQGRQRVAFEFPVLRLPAGAYTFCIFLVMPAPDGSRVVTDVRSWTHGNPLTLEVTGATSPAAIRLPMTLRRLEGA